MTSNHHHPHSDDYQAAEDAAYIAACQAEASTLVTDIPLPWLHPFGLVIEVEYPADRPLVVDLVLSNGNRTAETRTARYALRSGGVWDLARALDAVENADAEEHTAWGRKETDPCERGTVGCSVLHADYPDDLDCEVW